MIKPYLPLAWSILIILGALILQQFTPLDQWLFPFINNVGDFSPTLSLLMSYLGDSRFAAVVLIITFRHHPHLLLQSIVGALLVHFGVQAAKAWFAFPRPELLLGTGNLVVIGPHLALHDFAFPSGHAATVSLYATLLLRQFYSRVFAIILITCCTLVIFGRMFVGAHWPTDLLAGLSFGFLVAYLTQFLPNFAAINFVAYLLCGIFTVELLIKTPSWFSDVPWLWYLELPFFIFMLYVAGRGLVAEIRKYWSRDG